MLLVRSFLQVLCVLWRLEEKDLQQSKKVRAKKRKYYFHKKKVASVVAAESESPSVVPSVEEEVAIVGESSAVLAPSIFPDETSGIVADVANSVPADVM